MEYTFDSITTISACNEAIEACKANPALASMVAPLEAHRESLQAKIEEAKKWQPFMKLADKAIGELPEYSPDWRKAEACQTIAIVTRDLPDDEADDVLVTLADGNEEWRKPRKLVREIVLGVMPTQLPSGSKPVTLRKKAITVLKIESYDQPPTVIGHFRNGEEACKHLGIDTKADSAPRKLKDAGYILQPYDGSDYTVAES